MRILIKSVIALTMFFSVHITFAEGTWTYYMDGNDIKAFALKGDFIYCATDGGLVIWNRHDKTYEQAMYFAETGCCQYQRTMFIAIAVDQNGVIWCTNNEGELLAYDGEGWTVFTPENSGLPEHPQTLYVDSDNVLWMSTRDVTACFDGTSWTTYTADGVGHTIKKMLGVDKNNVKWFYTDAGVSSFDGSTWKAYTKDNGFPGSEVNAMTVSTDNVKWFAMEDRTITSFDGTAWVTHEGIEYGASSIAVDGNTVWCGTSVGLYTYDGTSWEYYNYDNSDLPCNNIEALAVDDEGMLWVINDSGRSIPEDMSVDKPDLFRGLKRYDGSTWSTWLIDGPLDYGITEVMVDHDNVKWFGTRTKGVSSFDGNEWQTYTMADTTRLTRVSALAADNDNVLWMSYVSEHEDRINGRIEDWYVPGIMSFDGVIWTKYPKDVTGLPQGSASSIAVDHDNVVWFASGKTVVSFDGTKWITHTDDEMGFSVNRPVIAVDRDNLKWFGVSGGVASFDGTTWEYYSVEEVGKLYQISVDQDNVKWFQSIGSVTSFNGSKFEYFKSPETKAYITYDMAVDGYGFKWFTSVVRPGSGLLCYNGNTWTYYRDDFWLLYSGGSMAIDHDNVKWVVTTNGIACFDGGPRGEPTQISDSDELPSSLRITAHYPNPFNPSTTIEFVLPGFGYISLVIYTINGQKVRKLVSEYLPAGTHRMVWDGKDDTGLPASSGVYISYIQMGAKTAIGKMLLLK